MQQRPRRKAGGDIVKIRDKFCLRLHLWLTPCRLSEASSCSRKDAQLTVQTLAFHPAPACPAPAPSQIHIPRLPHRIRRSDLPQPDSPKAKMILLAAQNEAHDTVMMGLQRQEYPTWLH